MIKRLGKHGHKAISVVITLAVIGLLIAVGPASAFNIGLNIADDHVSSGQEVNIDVSFDVENGDSYLPVENFKMVISNDYGFEQICYFSPDGSPISGCDGLTITPDNGNDLGYGYGYGYGYYGSENFNFGYGYGVNIPRGSSLLYHVSVDTDDKDAGWYAVLLSTQIDGQEFYSSQKGEFFIGLLGDLNFDGFVDGADLGTLLGNWGECPVEGECLGDLDGNGIVDGADLGTLLGNWKPKLIADLNGDGLVDEQDQKILLGNWGNSGIGDLNGDGIVDGADLGTLLGQWTGGHSQMASSSLLGDLNDDGFVNQQDTNILLYLWGPVVEYSSADFNEDGIVNGEDLGTLLGNWGNSGIGDLNGDGIVDKDDTNLLLAQWGNIGNFVDADFDDNGIVDGADLGTLLGQWTG